MGPTNPVRCLWRFVPSVPHSRSVNGICRILANELILNYGYRAASEPDIPLNTLTIISG